MEMDKLSHWILSALRDARETTAKSCVIYSHVAARESSYCGHRTTDVIDNKRYINAVKIGELLEKDTIADRVQSQFEKRLGR